MALGIRWWKRPVLPLGRESIGRRAYAAAGDVMAAMRPQVRTESIGGQRQIVIQANAEPSLARVFLPRPQLTVELPLQILVKQNAAPLLLHEFPHGGGFRILVLLGPRSPVPNLRMLSVNCLLQRGMHREPMQQIAFAVNVVAELGGARGLFLPLGL